MKLSLAIVGPKYQSLKKLGERVPRRWVRVTTVLTIALATGHVMQHGSAIAARLEARDQEAANAARAATPKLVVLLTPKTEMSELVAPRLPSGPDIGMTRIATDLPALPVAPVPLSVPSAPPAMAPDAPAAAADACAPRLSLEPAPAAMIALSFDAPCAPGGEVEIAQAGMRFKVAVDDTGHVGLMIPALANPARVTVQLGIEQAGAEIAVPDLADYDRVALAWTGVAGPELHAFEFGADYADAGHVWRGNARDAGWASDGLGGFDLLLGDAALADPARIEVYTYPAGHAPASGDISLTMEAEVSAESCGRDMLAQSLVVTDGVAADPITVTLAMPDCDGLGGYLVLGLLFPELTVAAR